MKYKDVVSIRPSQRTLRATQPTVLKYYEALHLPQIHPLGILSSAVVVSIRSSKSVRGYSTTVLECKIIMAWMYILQCSDDSYYVGSTKNLDLRFLQHQSGKAQDIHQEDCQLHWFIVKNMIVSLMHFIERNKSKAGLGASVKP